MTGIQNETEKKQQCIGGSEEKARSRNDCHHLDGHLIKIAKQFVGKIIAQALEAWSRYSSQPLMTKVGMTSALWSTVVIGWVRWMYTLVGQSLH